LVIPHSGDIASITVVFAILVLYGAGKTIGCAIF
jgi:hypothetical protein